MDVNTAQLAIVTRDVDAAIGSQDYLRLRDQGVSRVVYTTRGQDVALTSNSTFLGNETFINKYPALTVRVLKVLVQNAKWLAETQNTQIYQLWTKSGTTFSSFREDLQGEDFKYRYSPHADAYLEARYKFQIDQAKRLKLVRNTFSYEEWIEPKFLKQALKQLNLEGFWQQRGLDGKPAQPDSSHAANPQQPAPAGG